MNTAHRQAARLKHQQQVLPKWFRPKATPEQQSTCKVIHWDMIANFTAGRATKEHLLEWISNALTYSKMMELMAEDGILFTDEAFQVLADQLLIINPVVDRYRATGRAGFNGTELQIARAAAYVMDDVIELDRHGIADRAARWSVEQMKRIQVGPEVQS